MNWQDEFKNFQPPTREQADLEKKELQKANQSSVFMITITKNKSFRRLDTAQRLETGNKLYAMNLKITEWLTSEGRESVLLRDKKTGEFPTYNILNLPLAYPPEIMKKPPYHGHIHIVIEFDSFVLLNYKEINRKVQEFLGKDTKILYKVFKNLKMIMDRYAKKTNIARKKYEKSSMLGLNAVIG